MALAGIGSREQVEEMRGALLEVPDAELERADDESYFLHELVGLRVETSDGEVLGVVTDVLQPGANDVYVVGSPRGELLLPAIDEVIRRIDVPAGLMVVTPPAEG